MNCIKYVRPGFNFVPAFPLAKKGDVNGMFEQPIYTFLKVSHDYLSIVINSSSIPGPGGEPLIEITDDVRPLGVNFFNF